ncbi:histone H1-III-like [Agrilus planipennis]|uniref:Histone H1-III-like n=1 Tax=Agrilus planipennis TaxID=224129 RepID=A0A1W4X9J4_AGRPL|nr:histone H1-III-like [Agrilus planipennis]
MVNNAIKCLKERGGSSLQAIKKYVSANYKVDTARLSPFIKKYLKGAPGSFKLVGLATALPRPPHSRRWRPAILPLPRARPPRKRLRRRGEAQQRSPRRLAAAPTRRRSPPSTRLRRREQ